MIIQSLKCQKMYELALAPRIENSPLLLLLWARRVCCWLCRCGMRAILVLFIRLIFGWNRGSAIWRVHGTGENRGTKRTTVDTTTLTAILSQHSEYLFNNIYSNFKFPSCIFLTRLFSSFSLWSLYVPISEQLTMIRSETNSIRRTYR